MLQKNISSATWWSLAVRPWGELWGGDDSDDGDDDDDNDGSDDGDDGGDDGDSQCDL